MDKGAERAPTPEGGSPPPPSTPPGPHLNLSGVRFDLVGGSEPKSTRSEHTPRSASSDGASSGSLSSIFLEADYFYENPFQSPPPTCLSSSEAWVAPSSGKPAPLIRAKSAWHTEVGNPTQGNHRSPTSPTEGWRGVSPSKTTTSPTEGWRGVSPSKTATSPTEGWRGVSPLKTKPNPQCSKVGESRERKKSDGTERQERARKAIGKSKKTEGSSSGCLHGPVGQVPTEESDLWREELFAKQKLPSPRKERSKPVNPEFMKNVVGGNRPQVSFRTVGLKPTCLSACDMDEFVEFNCGLEPSGNEGMKKRKPNNPPRSRENGFQLDRRRTELGTKRNEGRKRKGSLYQLSRFVEVPKISDLYDPSLFAPVSRYMSENYFNLSPISLGSLLIDQDRYTPYYRHCFYTKEHTNFACCSPKGPIFISVEKVTYDPSMPAVPCRVFLRTCIPWSSETEADIWVVITPTDEKNFKKVLEKELNDLLNVEVRIIELQENSQEYFLKLEDSLLVKNYKMGVLSWNSHQKTEDEIFANTSISPDFQEFLDFLGDVVTLEGWPFYRAGLDVKANTTGKKSLFTRFLDYEVMFHVGAFLPHGEGEQQLGKKRHIGNDIVVIVFKECTGEDVLFDPSIFVSDFNHIFVVVQKMPNEKLKDLHEKKILSSFDASRTYYRVGFCSKEGVHSAEPLLPFPGIFEKNDNFRHFLFTKVLNSERSALYAQKFVTKLAKTRAAVFLSMADDLTKLNRKEKPSCSSLPWAKKGGGGT